MILKDLLKSHKLKSEIEKLKTSDMFDIVVYGSVVKGKEKANDIDIAIILNKTEKLNEKLILAEKAKESLNFLEMEVDVKVVDITDLMDSSFIARQAILSEGYSLLNNKFLHESFGFEAFAIFKYEIENLNLSQKKMFYYALKGRRDQKGFLEMNKGEQLSNCLIRIPIQHSEEFKSLLKLNNITFKQENTIGYRF